MKEYDNYILKVFFFFCILEKKIVEHFFILLLFRLDFFTPVNPRWERLDEWVWARLRFGGVLVICVCGSVPGDGKVIHVNIVKENAAEWVALIHLITDSVDPQQQASQSRGRKRDSTPAYIARRRGVMSVCGAFTPIFLGILIFLSFFVYP
jgi:hypothetical protein